MITHKLQFEVVAELWYRQEFTFFICQVRIAINDVSNERWNLLKFLMAGIESDANCSLRIAQLRDQFVDFDQQILPFEQVFIPGVEFLNGH